MTNSMTRPNNTNPFEANVLSQADRRMRFNSSRDPIYAAFDYVENRSVPALAGDLVRDSFNEIVNFVSKVVR